jgi:phosphoribulokinase
MDLAMQLIFTPMILRLIDRRNAELRSSDLVAR